jgi:hypothetical protein
LQTLYREREMSKWLITDKPKHNPNSRRGRVKGVPDASCLRRSTSFGTLRECHRSWNSESTRG